MKKVNNVVINEKITSKKVFLIDSEGEKVGEIDTDIALSMAKDEGLDLIKVSNNEIPVCKIMDKNKYLYELKKKEKKQNKNNKKIENKEIRISPNIAENDLKIKEKAARKFLSEGCEVKVSMIFRGREVSHIDYFTNKLYDFALSLSDCAKIKTPLKINGRNAFVVLVRTNN